VVAHRRWAHLLDREVEQACAVGTETLSLSTTISSARFVERIAEFNTALDPYADAAAAREFREQVVAVW